MPSLPFETIFLCTGNSARSIIAESILRQLGGDRFRAHSAGSHPKGAVHPMALEVLAEHRYPTDGLRSKSWDEFAADGSVAHLDFVFTVCDDAAGEACPAWPGRPLTAHWGLPDPAAVEGPTAQQRSAFRRALVDLEHRIGLLTSLPAAEFERIALKTRLDEIGRSAAPGTGAGEPAR